MFISKKPNDSSYFITLINNNNDLHESNTHYLKNIYFNSNVPKPAGIKLRLNSMGDICIYPSDALIEDIIKIVGFKSRRSLMRTSKNRSERYRFRRQMLSYLLVSPPISMTSSEAGKVVLKDHTTVLYSKNVITNIIETRDKSMFVRVLSIKIRVLKYLNYIIKNASHKVDNALLRVNEAELLKDYSKWLIDNNIITEITSEELEEKILEFMKNKN